MEQIKTEAAEESTNEPAREETPDNAEKISPSPSMLAQQYSPTEGGVLTDM